MNDTTARPNFISGMGTEASPLTNAARLSYRADLKTGNVLYACGPLSHARYIGLRQEHSIMLIKPISAFAFIVLLHVV